ncbi:MAG: thioredoxin domain-containing protein [Bacteroidia bacterium]|nr:thioredoxin domain-containing protein [Bacteroidia bacterium]
MSTLLKPPVNSTDHIRGNSNAPLELVEYGDFECSDCGHAYPIIKTIQQALGDDLKFVFRNFPLTQIHPHAVNAAVAAEAAALQNKFWEMHDMILQNQKHLESEDLLLYAIKIGLDPNQFENDMQNNALRAKVEADFESGVRSGVNRTPSFFINGVKYEGASEANELIYYLKNKLSEVGSNF